MDNTLKVFGLVQDSIVDGPGLRFVVFVQGCTHRCPGCHNPESQPTESGETYTIDDIYEKIRANGLVHAVTLSGGEPFEQPEACAKLAARLKAEDYNVWAYSGYLFEDLAAKAGLSLGENNTLGDAVLSGIPLEDQASSEAQSLNAQASSKIPLEDQASSEAQSLNAQASSKIPLEDQASSEALFDESKAIGKLLENIDVLVDGPFIESLKSYDAHWRGSTNQRLIDVPASLAKGEVVLYE